MKEIVYRLWKRRGRRIVAIMLLLAIVCGIFPYYGGERSVKAADPPAAAPKYGILYGSGEMQTATTGSYTLCRQVDTLTLIGSDITNRDIKWVISQGTDSIVSVDGNDDAVIEVKDSRTISITAKKTGTVTVNAYILDQSTNEEITNFVIRVTVGLAINRALYKDAAKGVWMKDLFKTDEDDDSDPTQRGKYSIIMEEGKEWELGEGLHDGSSTNSNQYLNLVYGSAKEDVTWDASNENVVTVEDGVLKAIGGGHAILTAIPKTNIEGSGTPDTIDVYVNPKVRINGNEFLSDKTVSGSAITINNRTDIEIPNMKFLQNDSSDTIGNRIRWKAERLLSDGTWELLCDSLDYEKKGAETIEMEWIQSRAAYSFNGKAGRYKLSFYPGDAYETPNLRYSPTACTSVVVDVKSTFLTHTIRLNVNGRYNLSEGLNIPKDILNNNSEFQIEYVNFYLDETEIKSRDYVTLGSGDEKSIITANNIGEARIRIKSTAKTVIPGAENGSEIIVTIIIGESFTLTSTRLNMAVGEETTVYGVLSTGDFPEGSTFVWSTQNNTSKYVEFVGDEDGDGIRLSAKKTTPPRIPVILVLEWTNPSGVTQIATCEITVTDSTTPIELDHKELELQSDDKSGASLMVTNYIKDTNLMWVTSDPEIAIVQPDIDYLNQARVIPQGKTGVTYITVINKDNNQTAVCKVTVNQYMTELKIDKGESFNAKLSDGTVLMKASYTPTNATTTDVIWTSTSPDVATVEYNGLDCIVQMKKAGTTVIRVASANQPAAYSVYAECILTVETVPLSNISVKESNLTMTVGSTYTVVPTLSPANATNNTLTWQTGNAGIARVDNNGVITAVKPGQTTITVSGGEAKPVSIIVNVMNKLNTIKFEETEVTIEEGEKHELKVIYSPEADVNTKITFTSTNTSVVTVDAKGVITGVSEGLAMIIATAEELGTTGAITCMVHVTAETIETEEFAIDPEEMTLIVGEEQEITPIYTPDDATHQEVTYTAGNEAVATVSEEGLVTAVSPGFTIITCQDVATGKTAICQVTVEPGVQFSLSPATREIAVGKSFKLKKVTVPSNAKKTATWKSSNKSIATVTSSGKVTGKKIGSCTITCTLTYYGASATCRVKVAKLKSTVKLNKTSIRMNLGSTYKLKKTVKSNDSKLPSVKFTSKNSKIASVGTNSGKIKAKKVGSTYITAKTTDASHGTARCRVTVIRRATSVSLNKTYAVCYIGSTLMLKAKVKPSNATIKKVSWSSSDRNIAAVTGSGKITGYAEGETYITATTTDGSNKKARCLVKVMEPIAASSILVAQRDLTMRVGDTTTLSYTVLPNDTTDTIKMASDNKRVATVTNSGKVRAVGPGNATITITSSSGVTATVNVNVVALNKTSIRIRQYDTETLVVHGAADPITWYSGNNSIATVTNGRIVGRGIGTTYVYAYINGCRLSCRVEVIRVS